MYCIPYIGYKHFKYLIIINNSFSNHVKISQSKVDRQNFPEMILLKIIPLKTPQI